MGWSQRPRRSLGTEARIIDAGFGVTDSRMQVGSCGLERVVTRGCIGWNGTVREARKGRDGGTVVTGVMRGGAAAMQYFRRQAATSV